MRAPGNQWLMYKRMAYLLYKRLAYRGGSGGGASLREAPCPGAAGPGSPLTNTDPFTITLIHNNVILTHSWWLKLRSQGGLMVKGED